MANLLHKASIITTPTAYGVGVLNSIKPAIPFGEELITNDVYSIQDTNISYVANNGTITVTMVGGSRYVYQSFATTSGHSYRVNITGKIISAATGFQAKIRTGNNGASIVDSAIATNGTISLDFVAIDSTSTIRLNSSTSSTPAIVEFSNISIKEKTDADFDFTRTSSATRVNPDYLIETVATDIPRLDYTNGTASILLEPQSTNLETKSNEFSTWSLNSNITRTADYIISPDGTQNATRLQFTANGFCSNKPQSLATYTMSCYAKRNDSGTQNVGFFTNGSGVVNSAWAVTNEWKRFSYTFPALNGSFMGIAGETDADISVYGFQLEGLASYPTSYIPTSGSAVTRAVEVLNNAGNSDLINSTEGALYLYIAALSDNNTDRKITLSDGTFDNSVNIGFSRFTGNINAELISGGVLQTSGFGATGVTQTNYNKFAMSWGNGITKFYVNGILASTHSSVTSPIGLNAINFAYPNNTQRTYARCKTVAVFKEALSDTELACLTSTTDQEIFFNYYYRMQYVGADVSAIGCAERTYNI